jgi:hypothetical protein
MTPVLCASTWPFTLIVGTGNDRKPIIEFPRNCTTIANEATDSKVQDCRYVWYRHSHLAQTTVLPLDQCVAN